MHGVLVQLVMHVRRDQHRLTADERGVERSAQSNERVRVEVRERLVEKDERHLLGLEARQRRAAPLPGREPLDRAVHLVAEPPLPQRLGDVARYAAAERGEEREILSSRETAQEHRTVTDVQGRSAGDAAATARERDQAGEST